MPILWNAGLQQQTPAVQAAYQALMRGGRTTGKRRKKKAAAPKRRAKKRKASKAARFVKGSKAAKAYMKKIRKKSGKRKK